MSWVWGLVFIYFSLVLGLVGMSVLLGSGLGLSLSLVKKRETFNPKARSP